MFLPKDPGLLRRVSSNTNTGTTASALLAQWKNPNDVLSVLLIIGGDIVQKALAQTSGGWFTPVCFSFGWVAYSFNALISVIGDGRLLPPPDYPAKVFNLQSGYARANKSWVIGRILRDHETWISKEHPMHGAALRISILDALPNTRSAAVAGTGRVRSLALATMAIQFAVSVIPWIRDREWGIFLVTAIGTFLALVAGALPQWKAEKLPGRQKSKKIFALTSGNGSRDIMVIRGCGECLDLEEMAASETPRSGRPWEKLRGFSKPILATEPPSREPKRVASFSYGFPVGFWITRVICAVQSLCWLALLITVAGLQSHTWYLLFVGALGMFQNAMVAAIDRRSDKRNLPLRLADLIISPKVMDGLMDLEVEEPVAGEHLLPEFFPGKLRPEEAAWWEGDRKAYDRKRIEEVWRTSPRSSPQTVTDGKASVLSVPEKPPLTSPGNPLGYDPSTFEPPSPKAASAVPDYLKKTWLDPQIPRSESPQATLVGPSFDKDHKSPASTMVRSLSQKNPSPSQSLARKNTGNSSTLSALEISSLSRSSDWR